MCDSCKSVYHSNEKHDITTCAIANSLICSSCKRRGHATLKCPDLVSWQTRVPEYVEQLIPYDLKTHYRITAEQSTPLQLVHNEYIPCHHILKEYIKSESIVSTCVICRPVIEIPPDKGKTIYTGNIRATLASNNLPSTSVKDNKKLLENFAAINGKKVIYLKKDRYSFSEAVIIKESKKKVKFTIISNTTNCKN